MKKFLLSLAVSVTAAFGALGQTVITADQFTISGSTGSASAGGFSAGLDKSSGTTNPAYNAGTNAIRLYANGTLTVSGVSITKIVVTLASDAAARYTTFTPSVGALNPAQAAGDTEVTWEGDAASVTFTVGDKATMGTEGETKAGQVRFSSITIYGEGGSSVDPDPTPDPDPIETVGDGTKDSPYTVADLIKLNNTVATGWVKGYIVGSSNGGASLTFTAPGNTQSASNVLIADNANETELANMAPVQLVANTDIRKAVNLVDNADNIGKELAVEGSLVAYFSVPGVKTPTDYTLDGNGGDTPPNPPAGAPTEGPGSENEPLSVAEAIARNNDGSINWVNGIIVGAYDYVDGTGNVLDLEAPFTTGTNIVIATSATSSDYFSVQLPAGTMRDLSLVDRPALLGKEVSVCGKLAQYCGVNGMRETTEYSIVGGLPELPVTETASLTTFFEEQSESNMKITGAVTVFYQSPDKRYTFITDGTSSIEVFGTMTNAYVNGDVLTGIIGKYSAYNNMPQMVPVIDSFGEAAKGEAVVPARKALADVQLAEYVELEGVNITEEEGKFYVTDGVATKQLYDQFKIGGIEAKAGVTVVGIGAIYGETQQIFPVEIVGGSAIREISTDVKGDTAIYDLQGRKVAKAGKGLYIVNGKKVIL